jgi:hypothetical protein
MAKRSVGCRDRRRSYDNRRADFSSARGHPPDFIEDFSDGVANGWNASSDQFTVIGNAYRITSSGASRWVVSYFSPKTVSGDFTYQLTTGRDGGGDSRGLF